MICPSWKTSVLISDKKEQCANIRPTSRTIERCLRYCIGRYNFCSFVSRTLCSLSEKWERRELIVKERNFISFNLVISGISADVLLVGNIPSTIMRVLALYMDNFNVSESESESELPSMKSTLSWLDSNALLFISSGDWYFLLLYLNLSNIITFKWVQ